MCSGELAIARTTSRTVDRPLSSSWTHCALPGSAWRSSICRYNSLTTCRASVVHGCCAIAAAGENVNARNSMVARYISTLLLRDGPASAPAEAGCTRPSPLNGDRHLEIARVVAEVLVVDAEKE